MVMNNFNVFEFFGVFKSKKYWKYFGLMVVCAVLMVLMIIPIAILTGEKEMSEFLALDWVYFAVFVIIELALLFGIVAFCVKMIKLSMAKVNGAMNSYVSQFKFVDLQEGSYDYVWLNFKGVKRAVISEQDGVFNLSLEKFNSLNNPWVPLADERFSSLDELKRALYYEHKFYCEENADMDEFGDMTFKN